MMLILSSIKNVLDDSKKDLLDKSFLGQQWSLSYGSTIQCRGCKWKILSEKKTLALKLPKFHLKKTVIKGRVYSCKRNLFSHKKPVSQLNPIAKYYEMPSMID